MNDFDKWQRDAYDKAPVERKLDSGCRGEFMAIGLIVAAVAVIALIIIALQASGVMHCLPMVNC